MFKSSRDLAHLRLRSLDCDPELQARVARVLMLLPSVARVPDGRPILRHVALIHPEVLRHHADHLKRESIRRQGRAQDLGPGAKLARPETVTQDHHAVDRKSTRLNSSHAHISY